MTFARTPGGVKSLRIKLYAIVVLRSNCGPRPALRQRPGSHGSYYGADRAWIDRVLKVADHIDKLHKIRAGIAEFCKTFPAPGIRV